MHDGPAHLGLVPTSLQLVPAPPPVTAAIASLFPTGSAERAIHASNPPLGYYRLISETGLVSFAKVVSPARAPTVERASLLGNDVGASGVPVPAFRAGPLTMPDGEQLFIYDWMDGHFFGSTLRELKGLGSVVANLHRVLPQCVDQTTDVHADWFDACKAAIARMAGEQHKWPEEAAAARSVIERWERGMEWLRLEAQPVHNDLHPGNVLFNGRAEVCAVLDFEEALCAWYSPLVDLSWVVERWCVLRMPAKDAFASASIFLDSYYDRMGRPTRLPRGVLSYLISWRSVVALSLLNSQRWDDSAAWRSEWNKFKGILARLAEVAPVLDALENRFR